MPHVVVLGAGVIGLQSAIYLLEADHKVTIVASHFPGDQHAQYTSPWAGAHWRTHAGSNDTREQKWDLETYNEWHRQIASASTVQDQQTLGLKIYDSLNYWDNPPTDPIWWAPHVHSFATLPTASTTIQAINASHPSPSRIRDAATFRAIAINVPTYLLHLRTQILSKGGTFIRATIPVPSPTNDLPSSLRQTAALVHRITSSDADVFVNATGLGAGKLCNDAACHPVKGQTVLVKGEAEAIRTRLGEGYISYVIPRPGSGTTVVGGTKEVGTWDVGTSEEVTERILRGARALAPELLTGSDGGFEVVSVQVGFRPGREGGARVEGERVGRERTGVVHAYGHDGAGYQNSVGVGREVVRLVEGMVGVEGRAKL
ncbi:D-amino-acid oxidase-like protein [Elsinoe australis]|uniref:D-amino-acid oxidase-like protein n=1 Tax=Elsinoe australis TaxID=40998 RepID=A0A4V6DV86_9PEZI|nr:D-amino-acid oxidase-like protein [Elsinoe australis]